MSSICTLTDIHMTLNDARAESFPVRVEPFKNCDIVVYVGDILNFDGIGDCASWGPDCTKAFQHVFNYVTLMNKPFLFTLGNHDTVPHNTDRIALELSRHPLHIGECNDKASACVYDLQGQPKLAMLYSGETHCPYTTPTSFYDCPRPEDAEFINDRLDQVDILFTHIPPPEMAALDFKGKQEDYRCASLAFHNYPVCSWGKTSIQVLPSIPVKWHAFGHDHDNLYTTCSENPTYMYLFKTGYNGYGPSFTQSMPGFSVFQWNGSSIALKENKMLNGSLFHIKDECIPYVQSSTSQKFVSPMLLLFLFVLVFIKQHMH